VQRIMFFIIYKHPDFCLSSERKGFRPSFTALHSAIFIVIKLSVTTGRLWPRLEQSAVT
jgi:hypothetical protein